MNVVNDCRFMNVSIIFFHSNASTNNYMYILLEYFFGIMLILHY